jgi:hypothetical protein
MADSYGNVSVVDTAGGTAIIANLNQHRSVIIYNNGTAIVYIGFDSSVTTSNGIPLLPQASIELGGRSVSRKPSIYGIAASGTQDVRYMSWDE